MSNKLLKIHGAYIIGILVTIIVVLFTKKFGDVENIVNLIVFGLATASFVVSIYALISQSSFTKDLSKLGNVTDTLDTSANRISALSENLNELPNLIKEVGEKVEKIPDEISANTLEKEDFDESTPKSSEEDANINIIASRYISTISPRGLILLYV
ncbi:hypothetical protein KAU32_03815 [bacterium]|nr:hypothetical protein [bacterium]